MPTASYLICVVSIYGKDGLQTNQGSLKIKVNLKLTLRYKVFMLHKYAK